MINQNYKELLNGKSIIRGQSEYVTSLGKEIGYDCIYTEKVIRSIEVLEKFAKEEYLGSER